MPRIRTLKPESFQHRKVGRLSDRAFRLWVAMICHADDHGRLVAEPEQLRVLVFGYHPRTTVGHVAAALEEIAGLGLLRRYAIEGVPYADFPSWGDHQRVSHPLDSKLPEYQCSGNFQKFPETSVGLRNDQGRDWIGLDQGSRIGRDQGLGPRAEDAGADWSTATWPSPEALAHLYNTEGPDNLPAVETLSLKRKESARRLLRQFPARDWWLDVFAEYQASKFLRGLTPPRDGHESFRADFDWLLQSGKKGTENAVRVHDGVYR